MAPPRRAGRNVALCPHSVKANGDCRRKRSSAWHHPRLGDESDLAGLRENPAEEVLFAALLPRGPSFCGYGRVSRATRIARRRFPTPESFDDVADLGELHVEDAVGVAAENPAAARNVRLLCVPDESKLTQLLDQQANIETIEKCRHGKRRKEGAS